MGIHADGNSKLSVSSPGRIEPPRDHQETRQRALPNCRYPSTCKSHPDTLSNSNDARRACTALREYYTIHIPGRPLVQAGKAETFRLFHNQTLESFLPRKFGIHQGRLNSFRQTVRYGGKGGTPRHSCRGCRDPEKLGRNEIRTRHDASGEPKTGRLHNDWDEPYRQCNNV